MLNDAALRRLLESEFQADRVSDDVTSALLGAEGNVPARAWIFAKEPGVFCGERIAAALSDLVAPQLSVTCLARDGVRLEVGDRVLELRGPAAQCLSVERTTLNLLSHLCGIATLTRKFVDAASHSSTKILATRKTLPGLRDLQLYAVTCGGGQVHRRSLSDGILIKENHQIFLPAVESVARARQRRSPLHRLELELQDLAMIDRLGDQLPDVVMLDNMDLPAMANAVSKLKGKCQIEVSGGVSLEQVPAIAELGVDYISVGKLTHSVRGLDLSMDISDISIRGPSTREGD